jgi:flagellar motor switch protein FliN/FliY
MSDENDIDVTDSGEDDWAAALQEQADSATDEPEVSVRSHKMDSLTEEETSGHSSIDDIKLDVILDIPVHISMEIGRTQISIRNLLKLNQGSVVELDRLAGEPMDVLVNGTLIARGEVVVVNEKFGLRLTDIISPAERVKHLR